MQRNEFEIGIPDELSGLKDVEDRCCKKCRRADPGNNSTRMNFTSREKTLRRLWRNS